MPVNTHLMHLEQWVLEDGVDGIDCVVNAVDTLTYQVSAGLHNRLTIKYDGSPAIFAGVSPIDGRFFIAMKGLFAKTPKLYHSVAEIYADIEKPDLSHKLEVAFQTLKDYPFSADEVVQGDIMYTQSSLVMTLIDGVNHWTFHPNTILYAVPCDSVLGKRIAASDIGIVWHTRYQGKSISELTATFDPVMTDTENMVCLPHLLKPTKIAEIGPLSDSVAEIKKLASEAKVEARHVLALFADFPEYVSRLEVFNNKMIRKGLVQIADPSKHALAAMEEAELYFEMETLTKKTDAARSKWKSSWIVAESVRLDYTAEVELLFKLIKAIIEFKKLIIRHLNVASDIKTYFVTEDGLLPTGHEGFVGMLGDRPYKLINREQFSHANFGATKRGWD